jgi:DNA repair protein SbcD/Mre11
MRLLHTADWHLGQKFIAQSREAEQALALDWLLATIEQERVEVLVVSGDVFDVHNPPVSAEDLYYAFLTRLRATGCRHVVVIGGNHDSPARLNAPRGILRALQMHVVGAATGQIDDLLLTLRATDGTPELFVAAIPFLRDRDFRFTTASEQTADRIRQIQEGIGRHYAEAAEALKKWDTTTPRIALGHLYASGASASEEQQNIYLGNLDNIAAEAFPTEFDYIALGHIHRAQQVGKQNRIRYCGSLIPLSFSEIKDQKKVLIVDISATSGLETVREVAVPTFRRLRTVRGELEEVIQKMQAEHQPDDPLPAWLEVVLTGDPGVAAPDRHLRDAAEGLHLEVLKIRHEHPRRTLDEIAPVEDLTQLSPAEVFAQRCAARGLTEEETQSVRATFEDLRTWLAERDV